MTYIHPENNSHSWSFLYFFLHRLSTPDTRPHGPRIQRLLCFVVVAQNELSSPHCTTFREGSTDSRVLAKSQAKQTKDGAIRSALQPSGAFALRSSSSSSSTLRNCHRRVDRQPSLARKSRQCFLRQSSSSRSGGAGRATATTTAAAAGGEDARRVCCRG